MQTRMDKVKANVLYQNIFIISLIIFSLLSRDNLAQFPMITGFLKYAQLPILIVLFFAYFLRYRCSIFIFTLLCFYLVKIIINIYMGVEVYNLIKSAIPIIAISLLVELLSKSNIKLLLKSLNFVFSILVYINLVVLFFVPAGIYLNSWMSPVYIIGIENQQAIVLIPAIAIVLIYSTCVKGGLTINTILVITSIIITVIRISSVTGIIGLVIILLYVVLFYKRKVSRIFSFKFLFFSYIIIFFAIVVFRINEFMAPFIENVLGKSSDLSYRTVLWDMAFELIRNSYLFGYGTSDGLYIVRSAEVSQSSHNYFIQMMLEGGIVSVTVFVGLLVFIGKNLDKNKNDINISIISISIFVVLILCLSEVYNGMTPFFLLLALGANVDKLIQNYSKKTR